MIVLSYFVVVLCTVLAMLVIAELLDLRDNDR